jgi:hypothetical protein
MQQTKPGGKELNVRLIERLWEVMSDLFGHKWTSSHDYTDNGSWATFLDDLTATQFKAGIDALRDWTEAWPPSATDFRNMCLGRARGNEEQNTIAGQQAIQAKALPLMITKQPTQEERKYGNEQLAGLMGLFATPSRSKQ